MTPADSRRKRKPRGPGSGSGRGIESSLPWQHVYVVDGEIAEWSDFTIL